MAGRNIAASLGGWSVRHRALAIIGWVVFVAVTSVLGSLAGQHQMTEDEYARGDSARAIRILDDAGLDVPASEMFLITSDQPATSRTVRAAVADLQGRLGRHTGSRSSATRTRAG